jgi:hypothetical protein
VAVPPLPRPDTKRFLTAYTEGLTPTAVEHLFTRDTPEAYRFFARHLDEDAIKRLPGRAGCWLTRAGCSSPSP